MNRIYFSLAIFIAIILGFIFNISIHFKILIPIILSVLMFFNFLKIEYKLQQFLKFELLFSLLFTLGLLPFIFYLITKQLNINLSIKLGLFLILITPSAIASPVVTKLINGNFEFSVANMLLYNFIAPLSYPLLLKLYFNSNNINISIMSIFFKLILIIFIPFLFSIIIKKISYLKKIIVKFHTISNFLFVILIFVIVSISSIKIKQLKLNLLVLISVFTLIIALINYLIGFTIGKNLTMKKTLAVSLGQKNTGLCIMVMANFNILSYNFIYFPTIIYIIFHHLITAILLLIFSRTKIK